MNDTAKKREEEIENGQGSRKKRYSWASKIKAVKQVLGGRPMDEVASEYGVRPKTISKWCRNWKKEFAKNVVDDHSKVDSPKDSLVTRAVEHWNDSADDLIVDAIGKNLNATHRIDNSPPRHSTEITNTSSHHERRTIKNSEDIYKQQLNVQQFSKNQSSRRIIEPQTAFSGQASLREVLGILQESKWFISRIVLLTALLGILHLWFVPPIYRADAILEIEENVRGTGAVLDNSNDLNEEGAIVSEEVEILKSRAVVREVVNNLKLDFIMSPKYFPVIGEAIARKNPILTNSKEGLSEVPLSAAWIVKQIPSIEEPLKSTYAYIQTLKTKLYDQLKSSKYAWGNEQIIVEEMIVPDSLLGVKYTVIATDNKQYQLLDQDGQKLGMGKIGEPLEISLPDGKFVLLLSDLTATTGKHFEITRVPLIVAIGQQQKNVIVREKAGVVNSGLLGVTLEGADRFSIVSIINELMDTYIRQNVDRKAANAEKKLSFMEEQLAVLEESMSTAEQGLNNYRQQEGSVDLATESEVILKRIVEVESEISSLTRNRLELIQKFKPRHPKIRALDGQVGTLKRELEKLNGKVKKLPDTQQQVLSMTRDVDVQAKLYSFLYNKIQELKVITAGSIGNLRVVDYATLPVEPVKPQGKVIIVAYLLLGLILGVGASFVRRGMHAGVHDPEVIEKQLGLEVLAELPLSPQQAKLKKSSIFGKSSKKGILAIVNPEDPTIEGLRNLRTSLYFSQFESKNNLIVITGPAPEVGKSFVSINYAAVLASSGSRVLVIDADFRRGTISEYVGIERHSGLSDLILGKMSAEEVIQETDVEGLDVITSGKMPSNPSELLLHENFARVLENISANYNFVIIDTPPILAFSDATVIARLAGSALLVVKSGMHSVRQLEYTIKQLNKADVKLEGVVFNGLDITNTAYGYGHSYGYSYSYKN